MSSVRARAILFACALPGAFILSAARPSTAQVVVAPNTNTTVAGTGYASTAPFNDVSRYQQIYAASQFAALTGPEYITQIAFRPASGQAAFSQNFSGIQFDLSTTTETPGQLNSTFATNVGANNTVVFSGPLTLSSSDKAGPGSTTQFDILVPLTTPFLYNPAAGSLLLDIRDSSTGSRSVFVDLTTDSAGTATRLNFVDGSTTTATGTVQPYGIVTRFTFTPAPEPSQAAALGLGALGLAGLALHARRRRACA